MIKKIICYTGLTFFIFFTLFSFSTVEITTAEIKNNFNPALGLGTLQKIYAAPALQKWSSLDTSSFHLTDDFYGFMEKFSSPIPKHSLIVFP